MRKCLLLIGFFLILIPASGQNFVGRDSDFIISEMSKIKSSFSLHRPRQGEEPLFLKYTNQDETETLLFILSEKKICLEMRLIFDRSLYSEKIKELDSLYVKVMHHEWRDRRSTKRFAIILSDDEWYYTVRTFSR